MDKRTSKIITITLIVVLAIVAIVSGTIIINGLNQPNSYDKVSFDVDQEDLQAFRNENDHDVTGKGYDAKADLFIRYALSNDDRDGDGYSTLQACVDSLKKECPSDWTLPEFILVYLQKKCDYVPDSQQYLTPDWAVYPTELLSSKKGDCEDFAILTAAILDRAGYDCAIAVFSDHAVALVVGDYDVSDEIPGYNALTVEHNGKRYYAIDASFDGRIGYTDDDYSAEGIKAIRYASA